MTSAILRRCLGEDTGWIRPYLSEVANDDWSGLMYSEVRVLPLYNLSLVLFYMEGFLHFLGWPEAYFKETTDAQGEGLRRIVDGVKFRRRSRWNRMQIRIRRAFLLHGSVLLQTLVFEYGAFVAPFLAIPFDWCGLSSVRCWYEKSAAARDGYIVAAR